MKIQLEGTDTVLNVSKITEVRTSKQMIHFDFLGDGTWRIIYNKELIPDFSKIQGFKVIRED